MSPAVDLVRPAEALAVPLVLDSPHSGSLFPDDFQPVVDEASLRELEDPHVDRLIAGAPERGATLVCARFARAYIDPNRHERDIDLGMLSGPWPEPVAPSPKAELGVGLVFRRTLDGRSIYAAPLEPDAVLRRIEHYHRPYHDALARALDDAWTTFGRVWHLNCHSMPDARAAGKASARADFCLGDRHGTTAARTVVERIREILRECGYRVSLNDPYAGVELVRRYGAPDRERHSVQVEVNRALYMDERTREPNAGFPRLRRVMDHLVEELAADLRALPCAAQTRAAS